MRSVRDELTLGQAGALQGGKHRVEAGRKAPELILPASLDAMPEVLGVRDPFRGAGQAANRHQRPPRDKQPQCGRERDPAEAHGRQHKRQMSKGAVHLGQWQRHLPDTIRRGAFG